MRGCIPSFGMNANRLESPGIVYRGHRIFVRLMEIGDAELLAGWASSFFLPVIAPVSQGA